MRATAVRPRAYFPKAGLAGLAALAVLAICACEDDFKGGSVRVVVTSGPVPNEHESYDLAVEVTNLSDTEAIDLTGVSTCTLMFQFKTNNPQVDIVGPGGLYCHPRSPKRLRPFPEPLGRGRSFSAPLQVQVKGDVQGQVPFRIGFGDDKVRGWTCELSIHRFSKDELASTGQPSPPVAAIRPLAEHVRLDLRAAPDQDLGSVRGSKTTEVVILDGCRIDDLDVLSSLANLREVRAANTQVSSVEALAPLTKLTKLDLHDSAVNRVPRLSAVEELDLSGTRISDISSLAKSPRLVKLDLSRTPVTDLAALVEAKRLRELALRSTRPAGLSPLASLSELRVLRLDGAQVADISALAGLDALEELYLDGTRVADLKPLAGCKRLRRLGLSSTRVSDLAGLAGLTDLLRVDLSNTPALDVSQIVALQRALPGVRITRFETPTGDGQPVQIFSAEIPGLDVDIHARSGALAFVARRVTVADGSPFDVHLFAPRSAGQADTQLDLPVGSMSGRVTAGQVVGWVPMEDICLNRADRIRVEVRAPSELRAVLQYSPIIAELRSHTEVCDLRAPPFSVAWTRTLPAAPLACKVLGDGQGGWELIEGTCRDIKATSWGRAVFRRQAGQAPAIFYEGGFKAGLFDGRGWLLFDSGGWAIAQLVRGKWSGFGVLQEPTGDRYEGTFEAGFMSGPGEMRYADGRRHSGRWEHRRKVE